MYLIKTDSLGNLQWDGTIGGEVTDIAHWIQQTTDGGYIVVGNTNSYGAGYNDVYLIRLESEGQLIEELNRPVPYLFSLQPLYPNPFNQRTVARFELRAASYVNLEVYDVWGRAVENLVSGCFPPGAHRVWFDGEDLPSGVYLIRLEAGEYSQARKIALIK